MSFHLRPPSVDKGVSAFFWAFGFFLYMLLGMIAIGIGKGTALVLSAVAGGAIFLYIRLYGEDRARAWLQSRARRAGDRRRARSGSSCASSSPIA